MIPLQNKIAYFDFMHSQTVDSDSPKHYIYNEKHKSINFTQFISCLSQLFQWHKIHNSFESNVLSTSSGEKKMIYIYHLIIFHFVQSIT